MHPSWRDLVIAQLAGDPAGRARFLSSCGLDGVLLAVSVAGGRSGARRFPLLITDRDWDVIADRISGLAAQCEEGDVARLLAGLEEAIRDAPDERSLRETRALGALALKRVGVRWQGSAPLPLFVLEAWLALSQVSPSPPAPPGLAATWASVLPTGPPRPEGSRLEDGRLLDWLRLARLLSTYAPEELVALGFPDRYMELLEAILECVASPRMRLDDRERRETLLAAVEEVRELCPALTQLAERARYWLILTTARDAWPLGNLNPIEPAEHRERVLPKARLVERILRDL